MTDHEPMKRHDELDVEPVLQQVYAGRWAAHGIGWAIHADTREEAIRAYWARVALYREVDARGISDMPPRKQTRKGNGEGGTQ